MQALTVAKELINKSRNRIGRAEKELSRTKKNLDQIKSKVQLAWKHFNFIPPDSFLLPLTLKKHRGIGSLQYCEGLTCLVFDDDVEICEMIANAIREIDPL